MMKYVHSVEGFLGHVKKVAEFNVGVVLEDGGDEGGGGGEKGVDEMLVTEKDGTDECVQ